MPDGDVLEPGALDDLLEAGGDDVAFVRTLLDTFRAESPALLATLRAGDAQRAAEAAHTLRSNAAIFGARRLRALCAELEERVRTGDGLVDRRLVERIDAACAEAQAHVAARLTSAGTP